MHLTKSNTHSWWKNNIQQVRMWGWFNVWKLINVMYSKNRMKKDSIILNKSRESICKKFNTIYDKRLQQTKNKCVLKQIIRIPRKKLIANCMVTGYSLNVFYQNSGIRPNCLLSCSFQHYTGCPSHETARTKVKVI
jgi:hypothetical protein